MIKLGAFGKSLSGVFLLNVFEVGMGFLIATLLTNLAGDKVFGVYSYVISVCGLISILSFIGQDQFLIRSVASNKDGVKVVNEKSLLFKSISITLSIVAAICIFGYLSIDSVLGEESSRRQALMIMPLLLFVMVLGRYFEAYLQGKSLVFESYLASKLIRPVCFSLLILLSFTLLPVLTAEAAIVVASIALVPGLLYLMLRTRSLWSKGEVYPDYAYSGGEILRKSYPFALIAGVTAINENIDMVVLAPYVSDTELAVYRISTRVASLAAFAIVAINSVFAPRISELYAKGELSKMEDLARKSSLIAFTFAVFTALFLYVFSEEILGFFGVIFISGELVLYILLIGKVLGSAIGSVGLILAMTKFEKLVGRNLAACCCINFVMNLVLIPRYGIEGAALSTTLVYLLLPLANLWFVVQFLEINPSVFSMIFRRRCRGV